MATSKIKFRYKSFKAFLKEIFIQMAFDLEARTIFTFKGIRYNKKPKTKANYSKSWTTVEPILETRCPRGVMVKAMNCGIVVREFVLQSRYYVHFRANTLGKGMNLLILPLAMGK